MTISTKSKGIIQKALQNLKNHKKNDKRSFGQILADSIQSSIDISVQVGGYIILFSVIGKILNITGVTNFISGNISKLSLFANTDINIINGVTLGILEMANGISVIASSQPNIAARIAASCFVLGFGGLSIYAQSLSIINKTDISTKTYTIGKISHGIISAIVALLMPMSLG